MSMQEYEWKALEQYEIEISGTHRIRGAVLCDTDRGPMLLKEMKLSEKRIPALQELHEHLQNQGYARTDRIMLTREGGYFAVLEDGSRYLLKYWFQGRECDVRKPAELLAAAANLAKLHVLMCYKPEYPVPSGEDLGEEYLRHNGELKRVRRFMRRISPRGEFETAFLKCFDQMYQWSEAALQELGHSAYKELYRSNVEQGCMLHGEYNYHNILMLQQTPGFRREPDQIAVTNFEKFRQDVQVEDLYYFLRKTMEKNGWKIRLGDHMLNAYSAIRPLTEEEIEYLKIRLIYPEKFWKLANSYYHSNKAWVSVKNTEKLDTAIRQAEEKKRFLEEIFAFHL